METSCEHCGHKLFQAVNPSFALPPWQSSAASAVAGVLTENDWLEIEDVVALSGDRVPRWLQRLGIPQGWQLVALPENVEVPLPRVAAYGQGTDGEWEATETIAVFGYTGWPLFYDLLTKAAGTLRALGANEILSSALPIPSRQWTAAVRSSGIALIGGSPVWARDSNAVWVQQTSYVAGSEEPHAGRLIVHSVFVNAACRARLTEDIAQLSDAVYQGFVAEL